PRLGETRFETWLTQPAAQIPSAHPQATGVAVGTKGQVSHKKASCYRRSRGTPLVSGVWERNGRRLSRTHDEIAQFAFSLYESRGRQGGHQIEDWLRRTGTRATLRVT